MIKKVLLALLALFSKSMIAQDTIVTTCNQVIIGKVSKVNIKKVIYKRPDQPDGPDYFEYSKDTRLVKYSNNSIKRVARQRLKWDKATDTITGGFKNPNFKPTKNKYIYTYSGRNLGEAQIYWIIRQQNDLELNHLIVQAKIYRGMQYIGYGAFPVGMTTLWLIDNIPQGKDHYSRTVKRDAIIGGLATIGVSVVGLTFAIQHRKVKQKAVSLYNEKY